MSSTEFFQFATAWVSPWVGQKKCQILVYLWREPDIIVVHHCCWYQRHALEFQRRWEPEKRKEAAQYFSAIKQDSPERRSVERIFKDNLGDVIDVG